MNDLINSFEIIRRYQQAVPVQLVPMARSLGLEVYRSKGWPDDLSGAIRKLTADDEPSESGYAIYVNADHPETRRRFTLAHEVAHFVLHRDMIGDGITDDAMYRSGLSKIEEYQANDLAAEILMPKDKLIEELKSEKEPSKLADKFEVSLSSMNIRLRNL